MDEGEVLSQQFGDDDFAATQQYGDDESEADAEFHLVRTTHPHAQPHPRLVPRTPTPLFCLSAPLALSCLLLTPLIPPTLLCPAAHAIC